MFGTKGEFFCSDSREGAVDAAGDLAVGHAANHCEFFRCPPAERAEPVETTAEALELAKELLQAGALPENAADDALHIAIAAAKAVPFLLTWNCRHLANAVMRPVIETVCKAKGFKAPIICTPEELLGSKP